jgi:hypothetical protein
MGNPMLSYIFFELISDTPPAHVPARRPRQAGREWRPHPNVRPPCTAALAACKVPPYDTFPAAAVKNF